MRILIKNYCSQWQKYLELWQQIEGVVFVNAATVDNYKEADFDLVLDLADGHRELNLSLPLVKLLLAKSFSEDEAYHFLKAIISSVQDAISVVDEKGRGILINPAYTRMTGLTESDVIGKPATVDIAEGDSMHYQVLKTKKAVTGVRLKVGPARRSVIVDVAPIIINGELKGSVGVIHDISEIKRLNEELEEARELLRHLRAKYTFCDIIGHSEAIKNVTQKAKKASQTPATVLLRGESGTGKELFAHAIHNSSDRKKGKFIRVNCPAIAASLMESELFGYEDGAFTGARPGGKKGLFEAADGGTIFLDEIANMDQSLQDKLLRVLQEREFIRVGGTKEIQVDVRVIAATNADLEQMVRAKSFREDLYYRLNVFPIFLPALRERKEDIKSLVQYMIRRLNQEYGRLIEDCDHQALNILKAYDWPGNVRELENIIGRAMIEAEYNERILQKKHLPPLGTFNNLQQKSEKSLTNIILKERQSLKSFLEQQEKLLLLQALKDSDNCRELAAERLAISIRSLYYKLKKYQLS